MMVGERKSVLLRHIPLSTKGGRDEKNTPAVIVTHGAFGAVRCESGGMIGDCQQVRRYFYSDDIELSALEERWLRIPFVGTAHNSSGRTVFHDNGRATKILSPTNLLR